MSPSVGSVWNRNSSVCLLASFQGFTQWGQIDTITFNENVFPSLDQGGVSMLLAASFKLSQAPPFSLSVCIRAARGLPGSPLGSPFSSLALGDSAPLSVSSVCSTFFPSDALMFIWSWLVYFSCCSRRGNKEERVQLPWRYVRNQFKLAGRYSLHQMTQAHFFAGLYGVEITDRFIAETNIGFSCLNTIIFFS